MGFINLIVGSESYINVDNKQLKLKSMHKEITYPIVDINSIVIDNLKTNISVYALNQLTKNNIIVYVCDDKHHPSTYLLGYNNHYRVFGVYQIQISASKPLLKNIWKNIIEQKILNQKTVLDILSIKNDLNQYCGAVLSGDSSNIEALVASKYFKYMFGSKFTRQDETENINSLLNYGYAILRGAISRSIIAHGLQPFLGIHHKSTLNNFNLADDLIEVFRPLVDLYIVSKNLLLENELTPKIKCQLLNLLNVDMLFENKKLCLSDCVDKVVSSYVKCLTDNIQFIKLPNIIEISEHKYE